MDKNLTQKQKESTKNYYKINFRFLLRLEEILVSSKTHDDDAASESKNGKILNLKNGSFHRNLMCKYALNSIKMCLENEQ